MIREVARWVAIGYLASIIPSLLLLWRACAEALAQEVVKEEET